ncbi:MAG TPA: hypothetical protein PK590_02570 [Candidatus Omnitrophota bacterium]|nr:hypothetical protein [Candidatus Omnitrophota bacterium]
MKIFSTFKSDNPAFPFTFEYPQDEWVLLETSGRREIYDEVYLRGKPDSGGEFAPSISIFVRPNEMRKPAEELLSNQLRMEEGLPEFEILKREKVSIDKQKVSLVTFRHKAWVPLGATDGRMVEIKVRMLFFINGEKSYQIVTRTAAEQAVQIFEVFNHILKTFKFIDR